MTGQDGISVIVPTITGRKDLHARTVAALTATVPAGLLEVITVRDRPCIGRAWNDGARAATRRLMMLAADDIEPSPGWYEAAALAVETGWVPSPRITHPDGVLHNCGTMGGGALLGECPTGTVCSSSPFPVFPVALRDAVFPVPDIHYWADDFVSWALRTAGMDVRVIREFEVRHLEGTVGRDRMVQRSARDRLAFLDAVRERAAQQDRQAYLAAYAAAAREDQEVPA